MTAVATWTAHDGDGLDLEVDGLRAVYTVTGCLAQVGPTPARCG